MKRYEIQLILGGLVFPRAFGDYYTNDEEAISGSREIMESNGYIVDSVTLTGDNKITVEAHSK